MVRSRSVSELERIVRSAPATPALSPSSSASNLFAKPKSTSTFIELCANITHTDVHIVVGSPVLVGGSGSAFTPQKYSRHARPFNESVSPNSLMDALATVAAEEWRLGTSSSAYSQQIDCLDDDNESADGSMSLVERDD